MTKEERLKRLEEIIKKNKYKIKQLAQAIDDCYGVDEKEAIRLIGGAEENIKPLGPCCCMGAQNGNPFCNCKMYYLEHKVKAISTNDSILTVKDGV